MSNVIHNQNTFSFFNEYFAKRDIGFEEGNQGSDTGALPPSATDKRFIFFITGVIRSAYNALNGNGEFGGARQWAMQTQDNLDKALKAYHNENGEVDMDMALTNPRILKLMDYIEAQNAECEAYELMLNEACDAFNDVTRKPFDLTTLTQTQANPVRKVEMSETDKTAALDRLAKLMKKTA